MPIKGEKERRREDKKNGEREKTGRDTERCASERPQQSEAHDKMGISGRINIEMEREEGREKATLRDWVARENRGIQSSEKVRLEGIN